MKPNPTPGPSTSPSSNAQAIDSDWPAHEQAAEEKEQDDVYGDPSDVKDESTLESLGKAVSSPVREGPSPKPEREGEAKGRQK